MTAQQIIEIRRLILGVAMTIGSLSSCAHLFPASDSGGEQSSDYLAAKVVRISEEYANINTDVSAVELRAWGVADNESFTVKYSNHTIRAVLGKGYSDVGRGEWIALIEEDGMLQLAISFGNAATEIGCAVGDTLYIQAPDGAE
jgi:S-adenosylmethionine hydrolase